MDALVKAITEKADIAVLVLVLANGGLLFVQREFSKTLSSAMDKLAEVVTQLRIEMARRGGDK